MGEIVKEIFLQLLLLPWSSTEIQFGAQTNNTGQIEWQSDPISDDHHHFQCYHIIL